MKGLLPGVANHLYNHSQGGDGLVPLPKKVSLFLFSFWFALLLQVLASAALLSCSSPNPFQLKISIEQYIHMSLYFHRSSIHSTHVHGNNLILPFFQCRISHLLPRASWDTITFFHALLCVAITEFLGQSATV